MTDRLDVYLNLVDAVQAYVQTVAGEDKYAKDWILACGVMSVDSSDAHLTEIRTAGSPGMPAYTATGLLGWAMDVYHPLEVEE